MTQPQPRNSKEEILEREIDTLKHRISKGIFFNQESRECAILDYQLKEAELKGIKERMTEKKIYEANCKFCKRIISGSAKSQLEYNLNMHEQYCELNPDIKNNESIKRFLEGRATDEDLEHLKKGFENGGIFDKKEEKKKGAQEYRKYGLPNLGKDEAPFEFCNEKHIYKEAKCSECGKFGPVGVCKGWVLLFCPR